MRLVAISAKAIATGAISGNNIYYFGLIQQNPTDLFPLGFFLCEVCIFLLKYLLIFQLHLEFNGVLVYYIL